MTQGSNLFGRASAAAYLGLKENTLAVWASTRRYPLKFIKVGSRVMYRKEDLDAFLASRTVDPAAAPEAPGRHRRMA